MVKRIYIKYVYWFTGDEEARLREDMKERNIKIKAAKGIVCTPLDEINKVSIVSPEVWDDTCFRQGSWYRASDKNGLYLVVSSFDLGGYAEQKTATITRSEFDPPRLANKEEKQSMIDDQEFMSKIPPDWQKIDEVEKRIYLRWAKRLGSEVRDYDFLYLSHTANHANFINPRFFIRQNRSMIPYSIDCSAHLCSCCLELFQVLGTQYAKKLVAPCPGATIFARLIPNRYLLVTKT